MGGGIPEPSKTRRKCFEQIPQFGLRLGFRQELQRQQKAARGQPGERQKRGGITVMIASKAGQRHAQRCTDPDPAADDALRQVEMAAATRDLRAMMSGSLRPQAMIAESD